MKYLVNITNLLVVIILLLNVVFIYFWWDSILASQGVEKYSIPSLIFIIEALLIISIIKIVYEKPIIDLEYTIKKFLYGKIKAWPIEIEKSVNPHLNYIILFFTNTLTTLKNIKDEFIHGKEIKSEVELGKEIQSKLLEKKLGSIPSLNVVAKSKPAWEIGWDSYDVIQEWDNYYVYVWDATGHWVGAWFIMMMVNALISWFSKIYESWAKILAETNEVLKPRVKANLLMTMLLIRWNEKEKRLFMTGAGHENLIVYKHKLNKCFKIKSWWVALGMIKDISKLLKEQEIKFEINDILVLYSDGITEAINQGKKDGNEQRFWEERLVSAIQNAPNIYGKDYKSTSNVFNNISIELSKFMGYNHIQMDDITLVVAHYRGEEYNINEDKETPLAEDFITEWKW